MLKTISRALVVTAAAGSLILAIVGGAGALTPKKTSPAAKALRTLVRQTSTLPAAAARKPLRLALQRTARHALKVAGKQPCAAVADLTRYRRLLRGAKVKTGKRFRVPTRRLAALGPLSLKASRSLLADKRTRRCGGGVTPSTRPAKKTTLLSSTTQALRLRVQMPALRFVPRTGGGHAWTQLALPNTDTPSKPGTPAIPVVSSTFAVPDGAKVVVDPGATSSYKLEGVDLYPAQPDPVDGPPPNFDKPPFTDKPFLIHNDAYRHDGLIPAQPASGGIVGSARDLTIGNLQIPAAQYDAKDHTLKVLNSVDVTIKFNGGSHTFNDSLGSPWEQPQRRILASLLNFSVARRDLREIVRRCGEEMLVITNPATRPAADQLAAARRLAGMRVSVFETGSGTGQIGTTQAQIQTFIRGRLTAFLCIHPSYVTIMGDDDLVPTFAGINGIPSDLQYSMRNDVDELPDVAVGRIIGNDQAAVGTAVTKIIGYETTAPTAGTFLRHALIAAQFQDDDGDGKENRTFIQFAETVRSGLVAQGHTVDRVYGDHPTATPQQFNDGTPLPAELLKPTFAWNGTFAQVSAAWNDGRFMVIHRDHGWSDGWGTPGYGTVDVQALTNGSLLPVVLSINCSSGAYDYDETSFAGESLVKANGGSVGVFGDTRDSPSWHNSQIALGFVDGLLPYVLPTEGPATRQRTGDALINGKLRLAGLAPPAADGNTRNELYLWHYFGDPSMQMWGGSPRRVIDPSLLNAIFQTLAVEPGPDPPPSYKVVVTVPAELAGQTIALIRNGQVIGKSIVGPNGVAEIPASFGDGSPKPGELQVAMEPDGAEPVRVPVKQVPKLATTLSQTCPASVDYFHGQKITINGTLSPAGAGKTIRVVFTRPNESTFTRTTTTGAGGAWTITIDPVVEGAPSSPDGTWKAQSHFDGDAEYNPSSSSTCSIDVFNGG